MQAKRHIKRTQDNPGGIITVEVCSRIYTTRSHAVNAASSWLAAALMVALLSTIMWSIANAVKFPQVPIHFSSVALIDPVTSAPVRTTWRYLEDGTKVKEICTSHPYVAVAFTRRF